MVGQVDDKIKSLNKWIEDLQVEEKALLAEITVCPMCGTELTDAGKECLLQHDNAR